jgi:hypothetical protein
MCAEAATVAVVADFFFKCWYSEIPVLEIQSSFYNDRIAIHGLYVKIIVDNENFLRVSLLFSSFLSCLYLESFRKYINFLSPNSFVMVLYFLINSKSLTG